MSEIQLANYVRWSRSTQVWVPVGNPIQVNAHMMAAPTEISGQGMLDNSIIAELDALRAEVERLKRELGLANAHSVLRYAQANRIARDERLRKGRDDERSDVGSVAGNADVHDIRRSVGYQLVRMVADTLDPRLGTPQPDGEPVAPMSGRKAYRWGMV